MTDQLKGKNKERSIAYPAITVQKAIELTADLLNGLGKGPYSREEAARGIGYTTLSGASARKVAALVHYGLLDRTGNAYSLSALAQDILVPIDEQQKQVSIVKAVRNPRLFNSLVEKYNGQALPTMLPSILVREGISLSVAEDVSTIFRESLLYTGLLKNGVVQGDTNTSKVSSDFPDTTELGEQASVSKLGRSPTSSDKFLTLPSGITLIYPEELAFSFAMGEFAQVVKQLNDLAVEKLGKEKRNNKIDELEEGD